MKSENNSKKDIHSRTEIIFLINRFYEKIKLNDLLGPVFVDIAQVNFDHHLPILYDFWCTLLLGEMSYSRNTMEVHLQLNQKIPLTKPYFDEWLKLFSDTVNEYFEGDKATEAITKANNIAGLMLFKIERQA